MAILNAETIVLLQDKSYAFTGLSVQGTAGTPPRDQQMDFGTVTVGDAVSAVLDMEVDGTYHAGGRITAGIGLSNELTNIQYEYKSAIQRITSLDLTGTVLAVTYGDYVETYTQL